MLRDHLIELRLQSVTASKDEPIDLAPHRAAMKQAMGEGFLATCEKGYRRKQVECALAAKEPTTASACMSKP
jgi:hypothetical protein